MHFGVFVLGTGNHSAGWRYDGAATSNNDLSVIQEIARHAERGKFDLLFVSDGLVMDPMAKYGRTPDQITVLPGVMPIIGSTEAEARDKPSLLQSWLTPTNALTLVTSRIGYDVTGFPLDGPVPAPPPDASSQTFSRVLYETARRENMTLRDLYNLTAAARGHWVLCGTPKRLADTPEEWFVEEAADGFNVLPPTSRAG
jgi:alkanesulfonate monooxygenase SsuD/methylene tetrahydromethanopterin reductase-like flavin-dependent oxidoreductase (luciferase family)